MCDHGLEGRQLGIVLCFGYMKVILPAEVPDPHFNIGGLVIEPQGFQCLEKDIILYGFFNMGILRYQGQPGMLVQWKAMILEIDSGTGKIAIYHTVVNSDLIGCSNMEISTAFSTELRLYMRRKPEQNR